MSKNTFQDITCEYFTRLDRLNPNDLNNYIVGLIHSQLIDQANWFLSRPVNQFHLERCVMYHNNHAEATTSISPSPYASVIQYERDHCYCWYQLSLQVIELLVIRRRLPVDNTYTVQLPHCSQVMTVDKIAECLGTFKFVS